MKNLFRHILYTAIAIASFDLLAHAEDDFTDFSLEELLTLEVTSVAKKPQDADQAATALSVITQEDIRRAGVSTLPEALRLVPGVEVAEIDGTLTAVSIRGFNWRFSNKLLVLVDGRAIYQPSLAGIFWDQQQVPVELIQRIEVIRGPGATMYGANAVNGVINIVTKHAADTLNGAATFESSFDDRHRLFASYGVPVADLGAIRAYATYREVPSLVDENGGSYNSGSEFFQAGFRLDLDPTTRDALTLQGELFSDQIETTSEFAFSGSALDIGTESHEPQGYNILGRWVRTFSPDHAFTLQAYVDYSERQEFASSIEIASYDLDLSHRFRPLERADIVWGLNYRRIEDNIQAVSDISFDPEESTTEWVSGFVQTEISVIPDRFDVTLGTKLEDNSLTGFEVQPSARFIWLGDADWSVWGAVSRAVRTPSRIERDINFSLAEIAPFSALNPGPLPITVKYLGDPNVDVEELTAIELGFRKSWANGADLDVALYNQAYDNLIVQESLEPEFVLAPLGPDGSLVPVGLNTGIITSNTTSGGEINGIEVEFNTPLTSWWSLTAFADYREIDLPLQAGALTGLDGLVSLGDSPSWQAYLRSDFSINEDVDLSVGLRRVSELEFGSAPAYTDLDIRGTWRVSDKLELSLIGENLLDDRRLEIDEFLYPAPTGFVERRVLVRAGLRF